MKRMNKVLSFILAFVMVVGIMPLGVISVLAEAATRADTVAPSATVELDAIESASDADTPSSDAVAATTSDESILSQTTPESDSTALKRSPVNRVSVSRNRSMRKAPQKNSDNPNTYTVLLLDVEAAHDMSISGEYLCTLGSPIEQVRAAALKLIEQIRLTSGTTNVAIVTFSSSVSVVQNFTADYTTMYNAISRISIGSAWANITGAYKKADELLSAVSDSTADKNIVLFSQGLAYSGEYSTEGKYSSSDCSWHRTDNGIYAYQYANVAYATAEALQEKYNLYSIGCYQSFDTVPEAGKAVLNFALRVAEDVQDSGFFNITNVDELEFSLTPDLFNLAAVIDPNKIIIPVKAKTPNNEYVNASGAQVSIFSGGKLVDIKYANDYGIATFSRSDLYGEGLNDKSIDKCTVSAHWSTNGIELCSETVNGNGAWVGASLKDSSLLIVSEPRMYLSLSVGYVGKTTKEKESRYKKVKKVLEGYSEKLAEMTNGHCILSSVTIAAYDSDVSLARENFDVYLFDDPENTIRLQCGTAATYTGQDGSKFIGFNYNNGYWQDVVLTHESGHYLFDFLDEYISGSGKGANGGEKWTNKPVKNYGVMDYEWDTIELSTSNTYSYLTDENRSNMDMITAHYNKFHESTEETLANYLLSKSNGYGVYTFSNGTQKAKYNYSKVSIGDYQASIQYDSDIREYLDNLPISNSLIDALKIDYNENTISIECKDYIKELYLDDGYSINEIEIEDGKCTITDFNPSFIIITVSDNSTRQIYNGVIKDGNIVISTNIDVEFESYSAVSSLIYLIELNDSTTYELERTINSFDNYQYNTVSWFEYKNGSYSEIETTYRKDIEDSVIPVMIYSSEIHSVGKYVLLAQEANIDTLSTISNFTVQNVPGETGRIHISFEDSSDSNYCYILYFSDAENIKNEIDSSNADYVISFNPEMTITVNSEAAYKFALLTKDEDGTCTWVWDLPEYDFKYNDIDNDGIPDYWFDIYPQLLEIENIAYIDSDGDGLDNLTEYQYGTNPLNPDTDGDNVYDKIELLKGLDPNNSMSNGVTDDYIVAYGTPELEITDLTFSESDLLFSVKNDTDGKAMRTLIEVTAGDETIALWTVNIDDHSIIDFAVDRNLIETYDALTITVDGRRITRDSDYSNNSFVYSAATEIALADINVVKQTTVNMSVGTIPTDSNDLFKWSIVEGSCVTIDSVTGALKANRIGQATVHVESLQGLSAECIVSVVAFEGAEYSEFDSRLINDNSQVAIIGYIGNDTDVSIPETIGGLPVTAIYASAFSNCQFSTLNIHGGIETIADAAFGINANLSNITVSADNDSFVSDDGVLYTKDYSRLIKFPAAREIDSYTINANTSTIGSYAFYGAGISDIKFGDALTAINASAFENCNSISEIVIPETVSEICEYAFANCDVLNKISYNAIAASFDGNILSVLLGRNRTVFANSPVETLIIGNSVETIPGYLFAKMESLKELTFVEGSNLKRIGNYAFFLNTKLETAHLPEGLTTIDSYAFSGCSKITSLSLPTTLTTIGTYAFNSCGNISDVTIHYNVTSIGSNAFNNCSSLKIKCYNRTAAYDYAVSNSVPYEVIPVPATAVSGTNITVLKGNTLELGYNIEPWYSSDSVTFNSSKTNIATIDGTTLTAAKCGTTTITITADSGVGGSFKANVIGVENAEVVDFDYSVSSDKTSITINDYTGDNSSAAIPNTIAGIPVKTISSSFVGAGLENLTIGKNVSTIYVNTFGSAQTLKNIYVDKDNATYADIDGVLTNAAKTSITRYPQGRSSVSYTVPSSITTIAGYAFSNSKIQEIDFSNANITTITWYAFSGSSLKEVTIPASVTSLGSAAFGSCNNLKTVRYNAENATYNRFVFASSTVFPSSVETLIIGDGVKRIPEKLFAGGSFTEIYIPLSVIEIDSDALGSIDVLTIKTYANNAYAKEFAESKGYSLEIVTCGDCKFTNWTTIEEPSCTVAGSKKSFCDTCGAEKTESIVPVGHKYGSWTKLDNNQHQRICENDSSHIEKENHFWNNGTVTKTATCTEAGIRTFTCTVCGAKKTESIKVTGHNYSAWTIVKAPTCTAEGVEQRVCNNDNKHVETRPIAKSAHVDNDGDGYCDNCHTDLGSGGGTHESNCVCGKYHTGPFAGIVKFFHRIVYFFKNLFGKN